MSAVFEDCLEQIQTEPLTPSGKLRRRLLILILISFYCKMAAKGKVLAKAGIARFLNRQGIDARFCQYFSVSGRY